MAAPIATAETNRATLLKWKSLTAAFPGVIELAAAPAPEVMVAATD
jgi:hypothetical protein